jgi:hypothetical protein
VSERERERENVCVYVCNIYIHICMGIYTYMSVCWPAERSE